MEDRYADQRQQLVAAVLGGPGALDPCLRQAAADGMGLPAELIPYVTKIHRHAYKVLDEDIAALLAAGWSEDELFELTISAALGAGLRRLEAGLQALEEEQLCVSKM